MAARGWKYGLEGRTARGSEVVCDMVVPRKRECQCGSGTAPNPSACLSVRTGLRVAGEPQKMSRISIVVQVGTHLFDPAMNGCPVHAHDAGNLPSR